MTIAIIKRKIVPILKREGVKKAAIFGSYARGEETKKSDVDVLVQMKAGATLFDLVGLKSDLEKKLGKKVDIITYGGIKPRIKHNILKDQKIIYEK